MRKLEVEHCDLIHSHSDTVRQIQEKIPEEQEIRGLADFLRYLRTPPESGFCVCCPVPRCVCVIWHRHWI